MTARYFEINEQGHNIRCKLYCADQRNIRKIVVFGHGFGGHKDNGAAERFAEWMVSKYKGTAMVAFNWPCHGDDVKKKLSLVTCDEYLRLVLSEIQSVYAPEHLFAYATSFGGCRFATRRDRLCERTWNLHSSGRYRRGKSLNAIVQRNENAFRFFHQVYDGA
jgi:hypothetical protein